MLGLALILMFLASFASFVLGIILGVLIYKKSLIFKIVAAVVGILWYLYFFAGSGVISLPFIVGCLAGIFMQIIGLKFKSYVLGLFFVAVFLAYIFFQDFPL